jgi:acyl dehydratase
VSGPFTVPVEVGAIHQFCRAIGEAHPLHRSAEAAQAAGFAHIVAPPTFVVVADQYDPDFPRRPRPGEPWPDPARLEGAFHVEQRLVWHRHPCAGDVLTARRRPARTWEKQGRRGGRLEFVEVVTELVDATGPVVVSAWVDVRTERSHASLTATQGEGTDPPPPGSAVPVGLPEGEVLVDGLTRTQIVMYVGAAGDFHPLHHDDVYAREHGYPGVFAPGMLTLALTARAVTARLGVGAIGWLTSRFRAQVWPGDVLVARATDHPDGAVEVVTLNQHGTVVLETTAGSGQPPDPPSAGPAAG